MYLIRTTNQLSQLRIISSLSTPHHVSSVLCISSHHLDYIAHLSHPNYPSHHRYFRCARLQRYNCDSLTEIDFLRFIVRPNCGVLRVTKWCTGFVRVTSLLNVEYTKCLVEVEPFVERHHPLGSLEVSADLQESQEMMSSAERMVCWASRGPREYWPPGIQGADLFSLIASACKNRAGFIEMAAHAMSAIRLGFFVK